MSRASGESPHRRNRRGIGTVLTTIVALLITCAVTLPAGAASSSPEPAAGKPQPVKKSGLYGSLFRVASVEDLIGHTFVSTRVKGRKLAVKKLRLKFFLHTTNPERPEKPTLLINGSCNVQASTFAVRNGRLRWNGPVSGTSMGCSRRRLADDNWLRRQFRRGLNAELAGKRLTLTRGKTKMTLRRTR